MKFRWRDNSIRIVALLMAVLLWVYVTNEQNPVVGRTYEIPLTAQGETEGYVISGLPERVSIRVKIPRNIGATLGVGDFTAKVNLLGITSGNAQLPVQVTAPPGVEVLQISPQVVRVATDKVTQKDVPVDLNVKGNVAAGFVSGESVVEPSVVTLHGPSKLLAGIEQLSVAVDLSGAEETLVKEVDVPSGVKGVTVSPGQVSVTLPVTALPVGDRPVRINLTGVPAEGYWVGQTQVQPAAVQVSGPQQVIDALTAVSTLEVDLSGVSEDVERDVGLVMPNGATSLQPAQVHITVRIGPLEQETTPEPAGETGAQSPEGLTGQ